MTSGDVWDERGIRVVEDGFSSAAAIDISMCNMQLVPSSAQIRNDQPMLLVVPSMHLGRKAHT